MPDYSKDLVLQAVENYKREGQSTKREGQTVKQFEVTTNSDGLTTERVLVETAPVGEGGNYKVTFCHCDEEKAETKRFEALSFIRVLPSGVLNLVTESGRWFLYAPEVWKRVEPCQPVPGQCPTCGHQPDDPCVKKEEKEK